MEYRNHTPERLSNDQHGASHAVSMVQEGPPSIIRQPPHPGAKKFPPAPWTFFA